MGTIKDVLFIATATIIVLGFATLLTACILLG